MPASTGLPGPKKNKKAKWQPCASITEQKRTVTRAGRAVKGTLLYYQDCWRINSLHMGDNLRPFKLMNVYCSVLLDQRCPTHSPLATCGEWPFKCGEWLIFQISQNWDVLDKILDHTRNSKFN